MIRSRNRTRSRNENESRRSSRSHPPREDIKAHPPLVVIEVWDQDKVSLLPHLSSVQVGKAEFLGRALASPGVTLEEEVVRLPCRPSLCPPG